MTVLPKAIYKLSAIPIEIPMAFFIEPEKITLNLYENPKDPKEPKQY